MIYIIVGPTAVGKTEISLAIAEEIGAEIISADSMQVYRGMDIGTAKPTLQERARVPHHLIDVADPKEEFSAGRYVQLADEAIGDIGRRGKIPMVVGGTGMYIRALLQGIFEGPGADFMLREALYDTERKEPGILYNQLKNKDKKAAEKIHPSDVRRIIRALEVFEKSGKPISEKQSQWGNKGRYEYQIAGLTMPRPELYRRIDARVEKMFKIGLLDEVKTLRDKGCAREMPSMHALGYKQLMAYLDGELGLDEAVRLIKRDTRHYAKRQYTWFNGQEGVQWVDISDKNLASSMASVKKALDISGDFR
ncbi:MAG: tRNA (adenosine(37)-N6)-dimethylallyltransferase MiaA [Nitrospirota bacterium]